MGYSDAYSKRCAIKNTFNLTVIMTSELRYSIPGSSPGSALPFVALVVLPFPVISNIVPIFVPLILTFLV